MLVLLAACADPPPPRDALPPVAHLVRASMVLRGVRPTVDELEAVRDDPAVLPGLIDAYLEDEAFALTLRDLWAEVLLLRNDTFHQLPALGPLSGRRLNEIYVGTVEAPLRLVSHIVTNDRPLTEIVTADYLLTNDITATIYGIPYDYDAGGWQVSQWPDERPRAGLLSSAQVWRRWESDGSNFNRGRADMVAREFLCEDFASRDIAAGTGIDIADELEVARAVLDNEACVSCHQTLDPLAGYFFGFKRLIHRNYVADSITGGCDFNWADQAPEFGPSYLPQDYCYPLRQYTPADEDDWQAWQLRPPSYYGHPLRDLAQVGQAIAADPRFPTCMARQFYGYFTQQDPEAVAFEVSMGLRDVLVNSGFDTKAMVKAAVLHPSFVQAPNNGDAVALMVARPEQVARAIEALTGYRWWSRADPPACNDPNTPDVQRFGTQCWGEVDLSDSDVFGFRAMAGGIDGKVILAPTRTFTPIRALVVAQLAADAAGFVVDEDFARPAGDRRLLHLVEADTTDNAALSAQIQVLYAQITSQFVAVDGPEVDETLALFELGLATRSTPAGAWKVVLTALLQDPALLMF